MQLHQEKVQALIRALASRAGLEETECAEGILRVANATMEKAVRVISVERGFDPRKFTLVAFGGAGGMHAAFLANELSIPRVIIPRNPGILSAVGMLLADVVKDYSLTVMRKGQGIDELQIDRLFMGLEDKAQRDLREESVIESEIVLERYLDMRYEGQSYEIIVPFSNGFTQDFHLIHEKMYGYQNQSRPVEIANIRLRARGTPTKPDLTRYRIDIPHPRESALMGHRDVVFSGRPLPTQILARDALVPGSTFRGPAIVVEYSSTTVVPPYAAAGVDDQENMIIQIDSR
jgi:N-methylhydantoinase A